jgi:membrane protease YdiL (CAAX protease family)
MLVTPGRAFVFAFVVVLAGGLREELQRAFILRRFDQHLGGGWLGLVVFSIAFGLGHAVQGWDTVIVTGALGALWGVLYLTRGSAVAAMVSHTGFNLTQIALAVAGTQS